VDDPDYEVTDVRSHPLPSAFPDSTRPAPPGTLLSRRWRLALAAGSILLALIVIVSVWLPLRTHPHPSTAFLPSPHFSGHSHSSVSADSLARYPRIGVTSHELSLYATTYHRDRCRHWLLWWTGPIDWSGTGLDCNGLSATEGGGVAGVDSAVVSHATVALYPDHLGNRP
jgi:hypothetical protein